MKTSTDTVDTDTDFVKASNRSGIQHGGTSLTIILEIKFQRKAYQKLIIYILPMETTNHALKRQKLCGNEI